MNNYKTQLRNSLFEKYFEVEEGVLLSNLVNNTNFITDMLFFPCFIFFFSYLQK